MRGRIFNAHLRRATLGGLTLVNTHPFVMGEYSFSHNGTVIRYPRLRDPGCGPPQGETDSEHLFNWLMCHYDSAHPLRSLRQLVKTCIQRSPFSGLNFLFSDGERLYAYKLGIFELHWLVRPGQALVASEVDHGRRGVAHRPAGRPAGARPAATRRARTPSAWSATSGSRKAEIEKFEQGQHLRGAERGDFAAQRAARVAAGRAE